ncbi:MAG: hypothetical protein ABI442_14350, partial [Gemmatimonadaceae bacterium]
NAMAQFDSIKTLFLSNRHSLGRFQRDTTLSVELNRLLDELATVKQLASNPNGTIGRFRTDSAITMAVRYDMLRVDSLIADMKKHPLRYISP